MSPVIPADVRELLLDLFGTEIDSVRIVEHSWINALHFWPYAVTRCNRIYLKGSAADFFAEPELVVHEFCHVLHQWNTGRLTTWRYIVESFRKGYWQNCFEIEARQFAAQHRLRYAVLGQSRNAAHC